MRKRIFLIEDDDAIRETVREVLETADYEVECARDGQEGLDLLRKMNELPALILLDLKMPKMDGYEFSEQQELDPKIALVPVLLMTADAQIDGQRIKFAAKEVLKKPLELYSFLAAVERYCL